MTSLTLKSPAGLMDMATYAGARTSWEWATVKEMHGGGETFLVSAGTDVVLLAGVYPLGNGEGEAWFTVQPSAAPHMLALIRLIRLTLRGLGYRRMVTICSTREGVRIANACGFVEKSGNCELGEIRWQTFSEATRVLT